MRKGQRPLATLASVAWPRGCVPLRADGARAKGRSLRSRPLLGRAAVSRGVQGAQGPKAARYARVRCLAARLCPAACRVATPQAAPQGLPPARWLFSRGGGCLCAFVPRGRYPEHGGEMDGRGTAGGMAGTRTGHATRECGGQTVGVRPRGGGACRNGIKGAHLATQPPRAGPRAPRRLAEHGPTARTTGHARPYTRTRTGVAAAGLAKCMSGHPRAECAISAGGSPWGAAWGVATLHAAGHSRAAKQRTRA